MIKIPKFIEVRDAGTRRGGEYIGITRNGTISIYSEFYKNKGISEFEKCVLLLDKEQKLIGLQFGGVELGKGAYSVNHDKDKKTAYIVSSTLFTSNGLDISDWYGKYVPEKYEDPSRPNVYFIDFDNKEIISRKPNKLKDVNVT